MVRVNGIRVSCCRDGNMLSTGERRTAAVEWPDDVYDHQSKPEDARAFMGAFASRWAFPPVRSILPLKTFPCPVAKRAAAD